MKIGSVVLDSDNAEELACFYQKFLGWQMEHHFFEGDNWIVLKSGGGDTPLVFQQADDYRRPVWPSQEGRQQQMTHLDFYVAADDYESEVSRAVSCGAVVAETQFSAHWKVLLDPAGHPFCIIPLRN